MALFDRLPVELLWKVWENVLPGDIENFAKVSDRVSSAGKPFLDEHRKLSMHYRKYETAPKLRFVREDEWLVGPVPSLFKIILKNPRIGHYIREVTLDPTMKGNSDFFSLDTEYITGKSRTDEERALYTQHCNQARRAIAEGGVNYIQSLRELGELHIRTYGNEDLLAALLLPLLPNLNSLRILWSSSWKFLPHLFRHDGTPRVTNLTNITLEPTFLEPSPPDHWLNLRDLRMLKSLPALKQLTAYKIENSVEAIGAESPPPYSYVEGLRLYNTYLGTEPLYRFLLSFRRLHTFVFQYTKPEYEVYDKDKEQYPVTWLFALAEGSKLTLQRLTINGQRPPCPLLPNIPLGSLQAFEALRKFGTEWEFLFPNRCRPDKWPGNILPASLRILELNKRTEIMFEEFEVFFQGLKSVKEKTCLHLQFVGVFFFFPQGVLALGVPALETLRTFFEYGMSLSFPEVSTISQAYYEVDAGVQCTGRDKERESAAASRGE